MSSTAHRPEGPSPTSRSKSLTVLDGRPREVLRQLPRVLLVPLRSRVEEGLREPR